MLKRLLDFCLFLRLRVLRMVYRRIEHVVKRMSLRGRTFLSDVLLHLASWRSGGSGVFGLILLVPSSRLPTFLAGADSCVALRRVRRAGDFRSSVALFLLLLTVVSLVNEGVQLYFSRA